MPKYTVTENKNVNDPLKDRVFIGDITEYEVDFSPWSEKYGTVTSVTWTVESGQAAVSGETLSSNVATANVSTSKEGKSLVRIKATTGTLTKSFYLSILAYDPDEEFDDYV